MASTPESDVRSSTPRLANGEGHDDATGSPDAAHTEVCTCTLGDFWAWLMKEDVDRSTPSSPTECAPVHEPHHRRSSFAPWPLPARFSMAATMNTARVRSWTDGGEDKQRSATALF